jgi:hypothetical protein
VPGTLVNILGTNFSSQESDNIVTFNGTAAQVEAASSTVITTTVPEGASTGPIYITVNGVTIQSSSDFTVLELIPEDTTPPVLVKNNTITEIPLGSSLVISAQFSDAETDITSVSVTFKSNTNQSEVISAAMTLNGNNYEFTIPSAFIGELGVSYKLQATNKKGLTYTSPDFILVNILYNGNGLTIPYTSFGSNISNYRIFSVPLNLDNPAVQNVLDELPPYDKKKWRISTFENSTNTNRELNATDQIKPGVGYWLLIKDNPGKALTTGAGKTVNANPDFTIQLKAGWNQIGNPYTFNVQWSDLVAANTGLPVTFRTWNGAIQNFENKTTLSPMEGGFVNVPSDMTLVFPSKKNTNGRITSTYEPLTNSIDQPSWEVDFVLKQGEIMNLIGGIGMRTDASDQYDIYDGFSMPRFNQYLDLNHESSLNNYHYSKDVVQSKDAHTWQFNVETSDPETATSISWNNSYFGNNDRNLVLVNLTNNVWLDMKKQNTYTFKAPAQFKVVYGSDELVKQELPQGKSQITSIYPVPTDGPMTIHVFIPANEDKTSLSIELKSALGNSVTTMFNGELTAGMHELIWNGEVNGETVPSGVYFVQLKTAGHLHTVRVMVTR